MAEMWIGARDQLIRQKEVQKHASIYLYYLYSVGVRNGIDDPWDVRIARRALGCRGGKGICRFARDRLYGIYTQECQNNGPF